jgi:4-hydroxy-3-methylbut-2-enyl diphosphate reductase
LAGGPGSAIIAAVTQERSQAPDPAGQTDVFSSALVDQIRRGGNSLDLGGGRILLPGAFGFCQGVNRALVMLEKAVNARHKGRLFLLGQIIHNPWVNKHFQDCGVRILQPTQLEKLQELIGVDDCAVIPAFGVSVPVEQRLRRIGCQIIDTSCGDVRRLWRWATRAVSQGYGVLIYGRARHDETVVTKSRLQQAGGRYVVVESLQQARQFADLVAGGEDPGHFGEVFGPDATNAAGLEPFGRLAQVSQTTMLYEETLQVRQALREAFERRFGQADERLVFQPTVCRATQDRQNATVELCRRGCDLVIVVGGFGSSNTGHLYELARTYCQAYFIEDASALVSATRINSYDPAGRTQRPVEPWLPPRRPVTIGLLAGASTPETVVGQVIARLGEFLGG